MIDADNGIFAVADGSERNPRASKDLLLRFQEKISAGGKLSGAEDLKKYIKQIYSEQDYRHKTTFSSVWVEHDAGLVNLHVASGGDSMVIIIDKDSGAVEYKTAADMKFAGRSLLEATMDKVSLKEKKYRVIAATDGYMDLVKQIRGIDENRLHEILSFTDVHNVAERLLEVLDLHSGKIEYDDIGFLIFDPHCKIENRGIKLLIGGTTSKEENLFLNHGKQKLHDEWQDENFWNSNPDLLKLAGIILN